ncbi:hypothetical protein GPALN_004625, partial [Globodera pallida]
MQSKYRTLAYGGQQVGRDSGLQKKSAHNPAGGLTRAHSARWKKLETHRKMQKFVFCAIIHPPARTFAKNALYPAMQFRRAQSMERKDTAQKSL